MNAGRSRSSLLNELVARAEPLMLIGPGLHLLIRVNWNLPGWLRVIAAAAVAVGVVGLVTRSRRSWALVRSVLAAGLLCAASSTIPEWQQVEFVPWFGVLAIGYPLMLGLVRALPVIVITNVGYLLVGPELFGRSGAVFRLVGFLFGGAIAGLIAAARMEAIDAQALASEEAAEAHRIAQRLQAVIKAAPVGIMIVDGDYDTQSNQQIRGFLGDVAAGMVAIGQTVHPDDRHMVHEIREGVLHGKTITRVMRAQHHQLGTRLAEVTAAPVWADNRERIDAAVIIIRDIQQDADNRHELERFRALVDMTSDIIGISSIDGRHYLNPPAQRFFGRASASAYDLVDHIPPEYRKLVLEDARAAVDRGESWTGELELIDSEGQRRPMSAVIIGVRNINGELEAYAVSYRDLTERKRLEARLAFEARHDLLTGLPNRQQLSEELDAIISTGRSAAVMFCDLDGFKVVNDSLGHDVGDEVLHGVADRLRTAAREDDIVGRLGGDEFLVVCHDVTADEEIAAVAQRLLNIIGQPIRVRGRDHVVSVSIGVALSDGTIDGRELMQRADLAMYASKQAGRNRVTMYDEAMRIRADERLNVERELRHALETGQIEVRYQPLVALPDRVPIGFEALVRWNHPVRGLLAPAQFLNVAEASGLAVQLGETVFSEACRAAAALRLTDPSVSMSINLSAQQLADDGLVDQVARSIARAGIVASAITIEITEEIAMHELEAARPKLDDLRSLGIRLAIDDFGTGHSNLALLRNLSADFVKIDRSLIDGLGTVPGDTQVVRMILSLTEELGFAPIAEGVSQEAQLEELLNLDCRVAQGHLFAEPMTLMDAIRYLGSAQPVTAGTQPSSGTGTA